jgi:hypothetical protein
MTDETLPHTNGGVGGAAKQVAEHASSIARLEVELAVLELKKKVAALGIGIGMTLAAAVLGVFVLGFAFATLAAVFATFLSTWLALLVVTGILLLLCGGLGVAGLALIRKSSPPVPERALREARLTSNRLKR